MPIYEYQCTACGHTLEVLQKISEPALTKCPKCNKSKLQKQVSQSSFQLKGTGWYATDFKNKGKPEAKKKSDEKKTSSGSEVKTETKTEKKTSGNDAT